MSELLGPRQIALVSSRATTEQFGKTVVKDDIDTIHWHMPISQEELLYSVSIPTTKHIVKLIELSGVFGVNFVPASLEKEVTLCSSLHGEHINKFQKSGFTKMEASHIECPLIKESCAHLECKVVETKKYKDHIVFIGTIINSDLHYSTKRLFHVKHNFYTTTKDI